MPMYDFRCCGPEAHEFERCVPSVDRHRQTCPKCGEKAKVAFKKAPSLPWYPDCTRSPYKEKLKEGA